MSKINKNINLPIKIARISTISFYVETQLKQQILDMKRAGFEVTIISSKGKSLSKFLKENNINYININISRKISIITDIASLYKLYKAFKIHSFDIVHSTTPKAGLLVSIAGFLAHIPIRLHTFTGQVWMNSRGIKKIILKLADKVTIKLNTSCYADGLSQVFYLKDEGVINSNKEIKVFGDGSLSGVDLRRFNSKIWAPRKQELLKKYNINNSNLKIIFVGRVTFDKGIMDLIQAFTILLGRFRKYDLILLGPIENESNLISEKILNQIKTSKNIHHFDYSDTPEIFYTMGDLFCLPSHREGFGTSVIEAASMGLATVGTNVIGLVDSILNNRTGILVPVRDSISLANALEEMLEDEGKRKTMSTFAFKRAQENYDSNIVNKYVVDEYFRLVDNTFQIIKE